MSLRVNRTLVHVAREAWEVEQRAPGRTIRGLLLMCRSMYWEVDEEPASRKRPLNLLDGLTPAGLEERMVRACPDVYSVNVPRAQLLVDAHAALLHFAERHRLIPAAGAARTAEELRRLHRVLERVP